MNENKKELQAQALALHTAGANTADIAAKFDISRVTAWRWITAARAEVAKAESLDNMARLWTESARLDQLQAALWSNAMAGNVPAARAALSVIQARIELHGVAAPQEINIAVDNPGRTSVQTERIRRLSDDELDAELAQFEAIYGKA
jgi:hypothetical protein